MHLAMRVVVAVEYEIIITVKGSIIRYKVLQDKGLKQPAHVCQVPLGRAGLHDRLYLVVIGHQWGANPFR